MVFSTLVESQQPGFLWLPLICVSHAVLKSYPGIRSVSSFTSAPYPSQALLTGHVLRATGKWWHFDWVSHILEIDNNACNALLAGSKNVLSVDKWNLPLNLADIKLRMTWKVVRGLCCRPLVLSGGSFTICMLRQSYKCCNTAQDKHAVLVC